MIGLRRGPFAPLPEGGEVVLGLDSRGAAVYFWRDEYRTHLNRAPVYASKALNVVTIRPPGERGAPRATATVCLCDGRVTFDMAGGLGLHIAGPLVWTYYPRDHARGGMFKVLTDIANGWRFPTPLRRLLPVPKPGELIMASNDAGGFYAFLDDAEQVVAVVLRLEGQELQASVLTLSCGPFTRWQLMDHARLSGFDSQFVQFNRILGREAERVVEYLVCVAGRGLFTFSRRRKRC